MTDKVAPAEAKAPFGEENAKSEGVNQYVFLFSDVEKAEEHVGGDWEATRGLLGGKGANLGEMTRIGVPVPPGFTVSTEACNAYTDGGFKFPEGMWEQEIEAMKTVEAATGKSFGDPQNPLLVSARSGAKFSMPSFMTYTAGWSRCSAQSYSGLMIMYSRESSPSSATNMA